MVSKMDVKIKFFNKILHIKMAQPLEVLSVIISLSFLLILIIILYMIFTANYQSVTRITTESPMKTNLELNI